MRYKEFYYVGTVGQYLLPRYRTREPLKYISIQGDKGSIKDLPADTLVVEGKIHQSSPSMAGGHGYFFYDGKSGKVIGFILMK